MHKFMVENWQIWPVWTSKFLDAPKKREKSGIFEHEAAVFLRSGEKWGTKTLKQHDSTLTSLHCGDLYASVYGGKYKIYHH